MTMLSSDLKTLTVTVASLRGFLVGVGKYARYDLALRKGKSTPVPTATSINAKN